MTSWAKHLRCSLPFLIGETKTSDRTSAPPATPKTLAWITIANNDMVGHLQCQSSPLQWNPIDHHVHTAKLRHAARLGMAKITSFAAPTRNSALLQELMLTTGVAPPKKVKQQSMAEVSEDTFDERMRAIITNTKMLREELLTPTGDENNDDFLATVASQVQLPPFDEIPPGLRKVCYDYSNPDLIKVPFTSVCEPPITKPFPPPCAQRRIPESEMPKCDSDLLMEEWRETYEAAHSTYMQENKAFFAAIKAGQPPPKVTPQAFDNKIYKPQFRNLHWVTGTGKPPRILDTTTRVSDHLKRDFFKKDWEDLPDQEILSMVIDGISNKCQCQFYNVFSPPLSSLAGAVDQLLDQAVERYDRNWVTVHTAQPFHPCIYVANGSTPKKNSLPPNDKRLTTHYSWPHDEIFPLASMRQNADGTYTAQAGDVPVIPINTGHKAFEPANPPEVKPMAKQISQNCTALEHMSTVVGEPVIYFSWDWKDYFPQFFMRMDELHRNVRVVPCTTKMANHFGIPLPQTELIQLNDTRMAFGCSPSSNYGQRIGNGLLWSWRRIFQALERESLKTARPAVIQYLRKRKRLCKPESGSSLKQNVRAEAVVFTDDPKIGACGYTAYKNAVLAFAILMDATGLLVSGLNKMQAGMAVNYTGAWYFAGIGLIVASREKRLRAIAGLQEIFNYKCSYGDYRKLVGLLNFLQFLEHNNEDLMLSTSGALNLYAPLCRPGNQTATKVTPKAYPDLVGSWLLWCDVAATRNGVPFSHAIKQSDKPDPSAEYIHIYGDAFKDDSGAGIGTFMHGYYSNLMLTTELSIPILEAVAPLVGLITFQNLLPNRMDQWHVWLHADGSAIAHVMQNHKPTSPLMRFVWKTMKNHSAFKKLADNMVVDHTFGEANPVGDAPSRNNIGELTELCQAMNVKAQRIPMPPDAIEFVARVEAFNSTLASSRKPAAGTKRTLSDRERGNTPANPSFQSPFAHAMPALEAIAAPLSNKEGRAIHRQGVMGEKLAVCVDKFRVTAHNVSSRISTIIQRARDEQWNTAGLRYAAYEANLQLRKALTKHDNDVSELRTLGWRDAASPTCLLCSFNGCIYGHPHSNVNTTSDGDDGGSGGGDNGGGGGSDDGGDGGGDNNSSDDGGGGGANDDTTQPVAASQLLPRRPRYLPDLPDYDRRSRPRRRITAPEADENDDETETEDDLTQSSSHTRPQATPAKRPFANEEGNDPMSPCPQLDSLIQAGAVGLTPDQLGQQHKCRRLMRDSPSPGSQPTASTSTNQPAARAPANIHARWEVQTHFNILRPRMAVCLPVPATPPRMAVCLPVPATPQSAAPKFTARADGPDSGGSSSPEEGAKTPQRPDSPRVEAVPNQLHSVQQSPSTRPLTKEERSNTVAHAAFTSPFAHAMPHPTGASRGESAASSARDARKGGRPSPKAGRREPATSDTPAAGESDDQPGGEVRRGTRVRNKPLEVLNPTPSGAQGLVAIQGRKQSATSPEPQLITASSQGTTAPTSTTKSATAERGTSREEREEQDARSMPPPPAKRRCTEVSQHAPEPLGKEKHGSASGVVEPPTHDELPASMPCSTTISGIVSTVHVFGRPGSAPICILQGHQRPRTTGTSPEASPNSSSAPTDSAGSSSGSGSTSGSSSSSDSGSTSNSDDDHVTAQLGKETLQEWAKWFFNLSNRGEAPNWEWIDAQLITSWQLPLDEIWAMRAKVQATCRATRILLFEEDRHVYANPYVGCTAEPGLPAAAQALKEIAASQTRDIHYRSMKAAVAGDPTWLLKQGSHPAGLPCFPGAGKFRDYHPRPVAPLGSTSTSPETKEYFGSIVALFARVTRNEYPLLAGVCSAQEGGSIVMMPAVVTGLARTSSPASPWLELTCLLDGSRESFSPSELDEMPTAENAQQALQIVDKAQTTFETYKFDPEGVPVSRRNHPILITSTKLALDDPTAIGSLPKATDLAGRNACLPRAIMLSTQKTAMSLTEQEFWGLEPQQHTTAYKRSATRTERGNTSSNPAFQSPYAHAARLPTRSPPPKAAEGAGTLALSSPAPRAERAPYARTTDTAEQAANKRHKRENQVVPSTTARGSAIPTRSPTLSPAKPPPISPINIATGQSHETATPPLQLGAQNLSELYSLLDPLPGGRGQRAWNAVMEQHADLLDDVRNDNVKAHRRCAMSEWKAYLRFLNLKDWVRPDIRSLPERRAFAERLLLAGFIPWGYARMKPGSGREKANPRSMMAKARHVVAEHRDTYHVQMADTKAATTVLTAMLRRHVANFGPLPKSRKQAFENATLKKLLKVPTQTLPSGRHWDADSYRARNVNALMRYLSQSGDRKEAVSVRRKGTYDRSKMSRASVQYLIGKQIYADPTPKQRHSMKVGDAVLVVPACTKADFTGEVWGADPIILPFDPTQFNNAAVAIINMEDKDPVTGLARKDYPLFCSEPGEPFIACQLDGLLHDLLRTFMAKDEARKYSFHSFRSYLACCLKTAGASIAEIKRICRWLDDDSLRVYCRMEVESTTALLSKAGKVEPSTLTTAQLDKLVDRPNPHMTLGELVGTNTKWLNAAAASAEHVTHRTRKNLQDNLPPLDNHDDMMALTQEFGTADNIPAGFEAYIDLTLENSCTPEQYGLSGSEMGISHTRGRA